MSSGSATRPATTVEEAIAAYREIHNAGGSVVDIIDQLGKHYVIEELIARSRSTQPT